MTMKNSRLVLVLFFAVAAGAIQNVTSDGAFKNDEFIWATGVPDLRFSSDLDCTVYTLCRYTWSLDGTSIAAADQDARFCLSSQTYADIHCDFADSILHSSINISDQFNSIGTKVLRLVISGVADGTTLKNVTIKDCDSSSDGAQDSVNIAGLNSTFEKSVTARCTDGYTSTTSDSVNLTCKYNANWVQDKNCTARTTTTTETLKSNSTPADRSTMSSGDAAGTAMASLQVTMYGVAAVFRVPLGFAPVALGIYILYIIGSVLSIPGIFMSFFGGEEQDLNDVELAGVVMGAIGLAVFFAGLIWHGIKGPTFAKGR